MEAAKRLAERVRADTAGAEAAFRSLDRAKSGALEPAQVAKLVKVLLPGATEKERKHCLEHLLAMDLDLDGKLCFVEVSRLLASNRLRCASMA